MVVYINEIIRKKDTFDLYIVKDIQDSILHLEKLLVYDYKAEDVQYSGEFNHKAEFIQGNKDFIKIHKNEAMKIDLPFSFWIALNIQWILHKILNQKPHYRHKFLVLKYIANIRYNIKTTKENQRKEMLQEYLDDKKSLKKFIRLKAKLQHNLTGKERAIEREMYKNFGSKYGRSQLIRAVQYMTELKIINHE